MSVYYNFNFLTRNAFIGLPLCPSLWVSILNFGYQAGVTTLPLHWIYTGISTGTTCNLMITPVISYEGLQPSSKWFFPESFIHCSKTIHSVLYCLLDNFVTFLKIHSLRLLWSTSWYLLTVWYTYIPVVRSLLTWFKTCRFVCHRLKLVFLYSECLEHVRRD